MKYGTAAEVAAMAKMWTRNGEWVDPVTDPYDKGTNPTLTQVNTWLENISAQMNLALQIYGFTTPVTSVNAHKAISQIVVSLVADLCHFANSSGRFYTEKLVERGITPMAAILKDLRAWVESNEGGLLADGVVQTEIPVKRKQIQMRVLGNFPDKYRRII